MMEYEVVDGQRLCWVCYYNFAEYRQATQGIEKYKLRKSFLLHKCSVVKHGKKYPKTYRHLELVELESGKIKAVSAYCNKKRKREIDESKIREAGQAGGSKPN